MDILARHWIAPIALLLLLISCVPPVPPAAPPPPAAVPVPPPSTALLQPTAPPAPGATEVDVFYATDRQKVIRPSSYEQYYSAGLNTAELQYGKAVVTIPPCHARGDLERPFELFGVQFQKENGKKHVVIYKIEDYTDRGAFLSELQASAKMGEVFVFIHGFNTSFAEGLRQTAQLKNDLPFYGPALLYSWPSRGLVPAFSADINLALTTVQHLEQFLQDLAATPTVSGIHILAHSLGSRPLLFALYDMRNKSRVTEKIKNVILAAPEIPRVTYTQIATTFRSPNPYKTTLYVSNRDEVLKTAERLDKLPSGEFIPRLGDIGDGIFVHPSLQTIDASAVDTDFLGHHYFADTVVPDIRGVVAGFPPTNRDLVQRSSASGAYWAVQKTLPNVAVVCPNGK